MENHHEELNTDQQISKGFVPPRHWLGPEELEASYWSDPQVREKRGQEFFEKPVETISKIDQTDKEGIARRDFLTIMGASMAMASFACARRPVNKIIPYVVKPEEITPGVANWYASTCMECSTQCGTLVKNREGRPIKIEGNPDHPMNQGSLCARGQASLLNLYDPDRLKNPVSRSRTDGTQLELSWSQVDSAIQAKLKTLASQNGRVRLLSGEVNSPSTRKLTEEFLSSFKAGAHVEFEPLALEEIAESQEISYGTAVIPQYRFEQAEVVVSLGADFLGNWLSPVEHAQKWSKGRKLGAENPAKARFTKLYSFESMLTVTGSNADERYPVRPGDELQIDLALAHELIVNQKRSSFSNDPNVFYALTKYTAEKVGAQVGIKGAGALFKKIANELWANRGKSLVVGGGIESKTQYAVGLQIVINLLNSALENDGATVDGIQNTSISRSSYSKMSRLISDMKQGQVDALIVDHANPAYYFASLGTKGAWEEAVKKVPLVIVLSDRVDETGLLADYVLPTPHALENWGDASPRLGLYSLQQPTIAPIHSTRSTQDSFLTWMKNAGLKQSPLAAKSKDWHEYLQGNWKETHFKEAGGSFEQFWEGALRSGVFRSSSGPAKSSARAFRVASLKQLPEAISSHTAEEILLTLYSKVSLYDGRSANNAWLQEMPDPVSSITWDNYLNVGPALAKKLGVQENDVVEIRTDAASAELSVHIQPGLHHQTVSAAVGYGRRAVGKVGNQAGVDVFPFLQDQKGHLVFSGQSVKIRKTGRFYRLASTQWHTATEDRPIINDITLDQFRKNPAAAAHTDPHLRMETVPSIWSAHEYKGHRWGMAIDLNSCTGCGACVIACQAENNVPVVGRDQVRVSRQMHWIRIDRYYSGSPEQPNVVFQPMLCQHCENASCETVCPVLATVHDDEGVNIQVYNRCVGTRYCQNNCPYKVRRFNFFDHWKSYEGTMNLAWNPDVTVRTRGIMEKCSFCSQRVRDAKDKAKDAGETVRDGDIKTACQQTCPTEAIIFGDMNDPKSRVSRLKESPQAFRVLEVLNNKPSISYMTKVRNQAESSERV